jgi:hypothetical protein
LANSRSKLTVELLGVALVLEVDSQPRLCTVSFADDPSALDLLVAGQLLFDLCRQTICLIGHRLVDLNLVDQMQAASARSSPREILRENAFLIPVR